MKPPYTRTSYKPRLRDGMWAGWGYFVVPQWNLTIAAPPKAGSSTLKQFFYMNEIDCTYVPHKEVRGPLYFVVRHPLDRFVSLWKGKCRDKRSIARREVHGMTLEELMDYIESGATDVHWTPQTKLVGDLDATFIPLESLNWWWHQSGLGSLGTFNTTEGDIEVSDDLRQRVLSFYADDIELYHKAQSDLCWETLITD